MIEGVMNQPVRASAGSSAQRFATSWMARIQPFPALTGRVTSRAVLIACLLTIGAVATYDMYLTLKYAEFLNVYEQNPIARWLLGVDRGPVSDLQQTAAFATAKFAGTLIVLTVIQFVADWRISMGLCVAMPLAGLQIGLALYLTFGSY